jgi:DNA invertase Pin-like site-specific DNA recombinase
MAAAAKARGVKLGRPARLKAHTAEVMQMRDQSLGFRAIARILNLPVSSVHQIVKYAGRGWASRKNQWPRRLMSNEAWPQTDETSRV